MLMLMMCNPAKKFLSGIRNTRESTREQDLQTKLLAIKTVHARLLIRSLLSAVGRIVRPDFRKCCAAHFPGQVRVFGICRDAPNDFLDPLPYSELLTLGRFR